MICIIKGIHLLQYRVHCFISEGVVVATPSFFQKFLKFADE